MLHGAVEAKITILCKQSRRSSQGQNPNVRMESWTNVEGLLLRKRNNIHL